MPVAWLGLHFSYRDAEIYRTAPRAAGFGLADGKMTLGLSIVPPSTKVGGQTAAEFEAA